MTMINCWLNNFETKARICSAAQLSLVSKSFVEKVGLSGRMNVHLWLNLKTHDHTFRSVGLIDGAQVRIGDKNYTIALNVMEKMIDDVWIGCDFLMNHECILQPGTPGTLTIGGIDGPTVPVFKDETMRRKLNFHYCDLPRDQFAYLTQLSKLIVDLRAEVDVVDVTKRLINLDN